MEPYILIAIITITSKNAPVKIGEFKNKDYCEQAKVQFLTEHTKAGGHSVFGGHSITASKSFCFKAVGLLRNEGGV